MYLLYTPLGYLSRGIYPKVSIFPVRRNEEYPGVPKNNSPGCAGGEDNRLPRWGVGRQGG